MNDFICINTTKKTSEMNKTDQMRVLFFCLLNTNNLKIEDMCSVTCKLVYSMWKYKPINKMIF